MKKLLKAISLVHQGKTEKIRTINHGRLIVWEEESYKEYREYVKAIDYIYDFNKRLYFFLRKIGYI